VGRWVSRAAAIAALVCLAVAACLGIQAPWSLWGWATLVSCAVLAGAGLAGAARIRLVLRLVGAGGLAMLVIVRLVAASGGAQISLRTLPGGTSSRWLGRVVDEQDVSLLGARPLSWTWRMTREEREGLPREMRAAYAEMRAAIGTFPSPVLDTMLGRQAPAGFDAIVIEAPEQRSPGTAVVFLHGYGGSFTVECWLVARAAQSIGAVTVCPATGFAARWNGRDGERIVGATLEYLHGRGIRRVYLAGLSNGASGAAALAPRLAPSLAGLILISGAPSAGTAAGLPALVIHGERDMTASALAAHAFATRNGARYAAFDGGHFVLLMRREETRAAIADWLTRREAGRSPP